MKVLLYNELDADKIPNFAKMRRLLETGDFRSAEVKKVGDHLYRAKLDRSNRLLFALRRYQGETYVLALECIHHHAYEKSRFLSHGATIDETKIPDVPAPDQAEAALLPYVNTGVPVFHLLDKVLSFDEAQEEVYRVPPPLIVIGPAGSGKTALSLEKMKQAIGSVLYVTRSRYLVHSSRNLYYALGYANEAQEIDFLSFDDYLQSIHVPPGHEVSFRAFSQWVGRQRLGRGLRDAHQLFEEFNGVITGAASERPYLDREEYFALGIKQSIFSPEVREEVYDLFTKYLAFLRAEGLYDPNILSHEYLARAQPRYDFIVVDEVQDLTNVQLKLVLRSLREPHGFILCGDSNQIVHPNFFSWSKVKTFFYLQEGAGTPAELIRILHTNYRSSPQVTELANRILKLKGARFRSVDRESNYLMHSNEHVSGTVVLLAENEALMRQLDRNTSQSTRFAVIVLHPEQKEAARRHLGTPLVFSVQEAKGLEYDSVILYGFVSEEEQRFSEITRGVEPADLHAELSYARARDKGDKSLEIYKFHINALYVAATRAVRNIYWVEARPQQRLFELLGLAVAQGDLPLEEQKSSLDEWQQEARKLELQGKHEQAEEIRSRILKISAVPWQVMIPPVLTEVEDRALAKGDKKARLALFEYALVYHDRKRLAALARAGFAGAAAPEKGLKQLNQKYFLPYEQRNAAGLMRQLQQYGVDFRDPFNRTPLMNAARTGNAALVTHLIESGADPERADNAGFNAFQIALAQACADPRYAAKHFAEVYALLVPDSLTVSAEERLVKLDNRLMEFLIVNLLIVLPPSRVLTTYWNRDPHVFTAVDLEEVIARLPDAVVPERRKRRPYISSILSKNEINREDRYNRRLFQRTRHGHYKLHPSLSVRVEGEWRGYELPA